MEKIVVEWRIQVNKTLRLVRVKGVVISEEHNNETYRVLLRDTIKIAELANKTRGVLMPISARPLEKNVEFSFFKVIFKTNGDLNTFIRLLQSKPS